MRRERKGRGGGRVASWLLGGWTTLGRGNVREGKTSGGVQIPMQNYKSVRAAFMTYDTLADRQTHTETGLYYKLRQQS